MSPMSFWIIKLKGILLRRRYFIASDFAYKDNTAVYVHGYIDRNGVINITKEVRKTKFV